MKKKTPRRDPVGIATTVPPSALDACRSAVTRAQAEVDRLGKDKDASSIDKSRAETTLMQAVKTLARVSGETDITAATILRSKPWQRLMVTIGDALEPYPGALDAVAKALETAATLQ